MNEGWPDKRSSGVLLPVSALPSPYGIGTIGKEAREWIDCLHENGQHYWQVLPLGPTGYGDSPYQSFSVFAGNPYLIDLEDMIEEGILQREYVESFSWQEDASKVDYKDLYQNRFTVLKTAAAASQFREEEDFQIFEEENRDWLDDYALYMACKEYFQGKSWMDWDFAIRMRQEDAVRYFSDLLQDEIAFWKFIQFIFFRQWTDLRSYAREKNVEIIGDIPIYAAMDSADVWAHPELFWMDENKNPVNVAGCPPDIFSEDGQLWGNPLYDWNFHEETGFSWWCRRIKASAKLYDCIRIDHFIGIVHYYVIPYGEKTARNGWYQQGPGKKLIDAISQAAPGVHFIAEDLGAVTEEVKELLKQTRIPGMKVLEMAFGDDFTSEFYPHNFLDTNCIVYIGTHDNETALGFLQNLSEEQRNKVYDYLGLSYDQPLKEAVDALIRAAMASVGKIVIIQAQDILCLGNEARINYPATSEGNWQWRLLPGQVTDDRMKELKKESHLFNRDEK